jgi:hypothetical protein
LIPKEIIVAMMCLMLLLYMVCIGMIPVWSPGAWLVLGVSIIFLLCLWKHWGFGR